MTPSGAQVAHPARRGPPSVEALPVALLGHSTGDGSLEIAALGRAVDLPVITRRAEVHDAAARIANTLNLPKIVHPRRTRPPGIGPPRTSRATTASSYASIRAHDLRATFVTISLATGKTETWISDRTGHRSHEMIETYRRRSRTWNLGELGLLHELIPELCRPEWALNGQQTHRTGGETGRRSGFRFRRREA